MTDGDRAALNDLTWINGIAYRITSRDLVHYETAKGPLSYTVCSIERAAKSNDGMGRRDG